MLFWTPPPDISEMIAEIFSTFDLPSLIDTLTSVYFVFATSLSREARLATISARNIKPLISLVDHQHGRYGGRNTEHCMTAIVVLEILSFGQRYFKPPGWPQHKSSLLAWPDLARPKRNFCFNVNGRFESMWCVTLYKYKVQKYLLTMRLLCHAKSFYSGQPFPKSEFHLCSGWLNRTA